jgi:2-oxoglutarate dehydrogenase E2 component (dihydrolipoamide succinyltransferase)
VKGTILSHNKKEDGMAIAELVMPKLGESIMEATILKWHKKVGDYVKQDETVLDIATDKVDSEVPSTEEGIITEILFQVNDVVPIGAIIARIQISEPATLTPPTQPVIIEQPVVEIEITEPEPTAFIEEVATETIPTIIEQEEQPIPEHAIDIPFTPTPTALPTKAIGNRFYSPLVLNIANSEGISLSELERIPGTGNEGRVSKKDVLQYVADRKSGKVAAYVATAPEQKTVTTYEAVNTFNEFEPTQQVPEFEPIKVAAENIPTPVFQSANTSKFSDPENVTVTGNTEIIEMDRMRKLIAKHMVDSKHTSPHVTSFTEADVTHMVKWREKVKHEFEKREGTKLTYTPMFMECIAAVIKNFPLVNCSVEGEQIILKKDINIGMATALPNGNLIVPVIKAADQLNIVGLSKAVNGLADAARNGQLKPNDTTGATFTLTNVGTFGSLMGTPIIPQPQVAILAVGLIKKRAVVIETSDGDTIGIRHMMYLSLSYDHRVVDGSVGASFLTAVAKAFESWDPNKQWFQYL